LADANARPKSADSSVEMTRHLKVARDTAVKSRRQAMVTLKTIIINAPAALRQTLDCIIGKMTLIRHLAALRPGPILSTTAYVEGYYNRLRLDSAFGYITPEQAERQAA
jgi:transposase InsO family protein